MSTRVPFEIRQFPAWELEIFGYLLELDTSETWLARRYRARMAGKIADATKGIDECSPAEMEILRQNLTDNAVKFGRLMQKHHWNVPQSTGIFAAAVQYAMVTDEDGPGLAVEALDKMAEMLEELTLRVRSQLNAQRGTSSIKSWKPKGSVGR